ncbi:hypothetical protein CI109_102983 [Kwoniella shandongensis]|uniref:Uncharacterized protein n=1 Tax=Kwoniella shandongensis TaxID=1734106 RepID=A0A5M6C9S2_9TREE|nr:uncharacterized protein CI109_000171 [Kwoniella shandongensis]KAA5531330.1 hypothetical protein CI109_000171 [Kwoniella shandongensis]
MEEPIDPSALAAVLAADHPLIDPPLIIALLSDYPPSSLPTHLPAIKEQLGILEATLVPDLDDNQDGSLSPAPGSWTESTSVSGTGSAVGIDELASKLESVTTLDSRSSASASEIRKKGKKSSSKTTGTGSRTSTKSGTGNGSATSEKSGTGKGSRGSPSEVDEGEGFDTELELLKSLFPAVPDDTIRTALSSEISLQASIDHLLSLELIRDVEEHGYWPGEETALANGETWEVSKPKPKNKSPPSLNAPRLEDSLLLSPSPLSRSSSVGSKSSRKSRKKETRTIPLVDTLQRKATPATSRPSSRSASVERSPSRGGASRKGKGVTHGPSPNAWHTVSSLSSYLAELLPPHSPNHFLSYLHAPAYHSAYTAVRAALVSLPAKKSPNTEEAEVISRSVLEDVYGFTLEGGSRRDAEKDLEICVNVAGEDVATVMDLMDLLAEISHWPGDDDFFQERPEFAVPSGRSGISSVGTTTPVGSPIVLTNTTFAPASPTLPPTAPVDESVPTLPGKVTRKKKKEPERKEAERTVPGSRAAPSAASHPTAMDAFGQASTPSSPRRKKGDIPQVHVQNWRTVSHARPPPRKNQSHIPTYYRGMIPHDATNASDLASSSASSSLMLSGRAKMSGTTIEDCLAQAQGERQKRESAIRAAGRSFKLAGTNGRLAKGVVAGHYAEQAREAGRRAREWELQAARMVIDSQLQHSVQSHQNHPSVNGTTIHGSGDRSRTIDLHHLTVNEATTLASEASQSWWSSEKERRNERYGSERDGHLVIVTGVGRHSVGNRGVLGPAVAARLEKEGWKVERGDGERGYLVVWGRKGG